MVDARGVLFPDRLPSFVRVPPPARAARLVRWFWVAQWDLGGRTSRQEVIAFPALNLVVESSGVGLAGPTTRASHRDLTGSGWAVGALLRPAAVSTLTGDPSALMDSYLPLELPDLRAVVAAAMADAEHSRACEAFADWWVCRVPVLDDQGLLANRMAELIDTEPDVLRADQAAAALGVSTRTLQRLSRRYVGLGPLDLIRRRRLQEAAAAVRADPGTQLAELATRLGFTDQAHLTREFRRVLGFTPGDYRRGHRPVEPA